MNTARGNRRIVHPLHIPLEEVARDDTPFVGGDGGQLLLAVCVSAREESPIAGTPQVVVHDDASFVRLDARPGEIKRIEVCCAPRRVQHEVRFDRAYFAPHRDFHVKAAIRSGDGLDMAIRQEVHTEPLREFDDRLDEVIVEPGEGAPSAQQDRDLGPEARKDVSELEGDDSSADDRHAPRRLAKLEHVVGSLYELRSLEVEPPRTRAGRDHEAARTQDPVADGNGVRRQESGLAADYFDPSLSERLLGL